MGSDEVDRFYGPRGPVYSSEGTLNGRIENLLRFRRRGDLVRGTIFAWGLRPIPDCYRADALVPFKLAFVDSLGDELITEGTLRVNRRRGSVQEMQDPKETLFDGVYCESIGEQDRRAYRRGISEERTRANQHEGSGVGNESESGQRARVVELAEPLCNSDDNRAAESARSDRLTKRNKG